MGLIKFLSGLAFAIIFAIAIVSFSIGFGQENNAVISLDEDLAAINQTSENDLLQFSASVNDSNTIFQESTIKSGDENTEGGGQFKTTPTSVVGSAGTIIRVVNKTLFQDNAIISTTVLAFLVLLATLYGWKAWKGGNPD